MRLHLARLVTLVALLAVGFPFMVVAQNGGKPPKAGLELIAEGLTSPVTIEEAPDGSERLFIVDQIGLIWIVASGETVLSEPFLDLTDRMVALNVNFDERGLLGFAFHPDYARNGRFFVYYSAPLREDAPEGFNHTSHVSEFRASSEDPNRAAPDSERILLQIDQPIFNHNAGTLAFGPEDGYLYISLGDGGGANDVGLGRVEDWYEGNEGGNGQDVEHNLLGSILRIDVNGGDPYRIPPDNPFVGRAGLDEIWAYGFRNPYRFSFDMGGSHQMFAGDAGQELWEEVSIVTRGGNYGWNVREGAHCFSTADPFHPPADCPDVVGAGHPDAGAPLIDPVIEFSNSRVFADGVGLAVVGGYVYRGVLLPQLNGRYIFGSWSREFAVPSGDVFVAKPRAKGLWKFQTMAFTTQPDGVLGHFLLGFGQDLSGEIYVLTTDMPGPVGETGKVYKLTSPSDRTR